MTTQVDALLQKVELELAVGNFSIALLNVTETLTQADSIEKFLQYEIIQTVGGYAPKVWTYAANSAAWDNDLGGVASPLQSLQFNAVGQSYTYSHVCMVQGRGLRGNTQITAFDFTNSVVTAANHGLSNADPVFITSTGVLHTGLTIKRHYAKVENVNQIKLFDDAALTQQTAFTDTGTGTFYLRSSGGFLWDYDTLSGTVTPGSPKTIDFRYFKDR